MMEFWHPLLARLPWEWAQFAFMRNALLAILLVSPLYAFLGTMVVGNRMVFFSDVLGHSALTGLALGVILGLADPVWAMVGFAMALVFAIALFQRHTKAGHDTVLGVFFAVVVALGVVLLSRYGGITKYGSYLVGDVLTVTPGQIKGLALLFLVSVVFWMVAGNPLYLVSLSPSLARSRRIPVFLVEIAFALLLALVVMTSLRLVGLLIINSLLILPAAAARILARHVKGYTGWAVGISLFSGVAGLLASFSLGTASGATIVLVAAACYAVAALLGPWWRSKG